MKRFVLITLYLVLGISAGAHATTIEVLPIEQLSQYSTHAVQARCVKLDSRWSADKTYIYTRAQYRVSQTIRGDLSSKTIVVNLPGGKVGNLRSVVIGAPTVNVGDEAVLLLQPVAANAGARSGASASFNIVGGSQGVFDVKRIAGASDARAVSQAARQFGEGVIETDIQTRSIAGGALGLPLQQLIDRIQQAPTGPADSE